MPLRRLPLGSPCLVAFEKGSAYDRYMTEGPPLRTLYYMCTEYILQWPLVFRAEGLHGCSSALLHVCQDSLRRLQLLVEHKRAEIEFRELRWRIGARVALLSALCPRGRYEWFLGIFEDVEGDACRRPGQGLGIDCCLIKDILWCSWCMVHFDTLCLLLHGAWRNFCGSLFLVCLLGRIMVK